MKASRVLAVVVLLDAFILAFGHAPLALGISPLFRPPGRQPPPPPRSAQNSTGPAGPVVPFFAIGAYFLFATVAYVLGGILLASGNLFKLANIGLMMLAGVDNGLLVYTRTVPNILLGRIVPWSMAWFPLGTVQILIGQTILIALCATLLYKRETPKKGGKK